jgi:hypothetical protein
MLLDSHTTFTVLQKVVDFSVGSSSPRVDFRDEFVGTSVSALIGRSLVLHTNHGSAPHCPLSCSKYELSKYD